MRDNGEFIQDLRKEIENTQARRHKYVLAKLTFVTGLLGFGLAGKDSTATSGQLLYLVPLVTFVFDLYILGEGKWGRWKVNKLTAKVCCSK